MRSILTVTDEATSHNLTTVAVIKTDLGITDTSQDANLALWLTHVSKEIEGYCNRVFVQETVKETFRIPYPASYTTGSLRERLVLRRAPVASITSVIECGVTLDPASYEIDPDAGLLARLCNDYPSVWRWGKVEVNYLAGYETIPADLVRACITMVKNLSFNATSDPNVKADTVQNVGAIEYFNLGAGVQFEAALSALPSAVRMTLNRYRLHFL